MSDFTTLRVQSAQARVGVVRDPGRPFLTYYDDATGERIELSYATFDNWVAKTANLLADGLGVLPGDVVAVELPPHWQTAVVAFAVWRVGARIGTGGAVAAFVAEPALGTVTAPEVVGLSLDSFGRPLAAPRPGVTDYADEVPAYADTFAGGVPVTPGSTPVDAGERLLLAPPDDDRSWLDVARSAYAAGAGVVLVRHADPARSGTRVATERITRTWEFPTVA